MNTSRLAVLAVPDEVKELEVIGQFTPRKIKFAFFQDDFQGGKIAYWHVDWNSPTDFGTTLSMEGLKLWGYL